AHGRLVDRRGETAGRQDRQRAYEAGPCDIQPGAGRSLMARHHGAGAEAGQSPVESPQEPGSGSARVRTDGRRTCPLVAQIEHVEAGGTHPRGYRLQFGKVRIVAAMKPSPRDAVSYAQCRLPVTTPRNLDEPR